MRASVLLGFGRCVSHNIFSGPECCALMFCRWVCRSTSSLLLSSKYNVLLFPEIYTAQASLVATLILLFQQTFAEKIRQCLCPYEGLGLRSVLSSNPSHKRIGFVLLLGNAFLLSALGLVLEGVRHYWWKALGKVLFAPGAFVWCCPGLRLSNREHRAVRFGTFIQDDLQYNC